MTDTAKLNEAIKKSGLKKSYIAEKLGITAFGFARKVNNYSEFTASEIAILSRLLGFNDRTMRSIFLTLNVAKKATKETV